MKHKYTRAVIETAEIRELSLGDPITFVASTPGKKRDGFDLDISKYNLENYQKNPVIMDRHNYFGLPIGKGTAFFEDGQLKVRVFFDQKDEMARTQNQKYIDGFMNAVSVGWNFIRGEDDQDESYDLLEISTVPIPGDPDAVMERSMRAMQAMTRGFFGSEDAENLAPIETPFDSGAIREAISEDEAKLRAASALVFEDENGNKTYDLLHHDEEGKVVFDGLEQAVQELNARSEDGELLTTLNADQRAEAWSHLAQHYAEFDRQAPVLEPENPESVNEVQALQELIAGEFETVRGEFNSQISEIAETAKVLSAAIEELRGAQSSPEGVTVSDLVSATVDALKERSIESAQAFIQSNRDTLIRELTDQIRKDLLAEGDDSEIAGRAGKVISKKTRGTLQNIRSKIEDALTDALRGLDDILEEPEEADQEAPEEANDTSERSEILDQINQAVAAATAKIRESLLDELGTKAGQDKESEESDDEDLALLSQIRDLLPEAKR